MNTEEFLSPGPEYRGVTLWMLNDELELEEVAPGIFRKVHLDINPPT